MYLHRREIKLEGKVVDVLKIPKLEVAIVCHCFKRLALLKKCLQLFCFKRVKALKTFWINWIQVRQKKQKRKIVFVT